MKNNTLTMVSVTLEMTMPIAEAWALRDYLADHGVKTKTIKKCEVVAEYPPVEEAQKMAQKMADKTGCSCQVSGHNNGEIVETSAKPKKAEKKPAPKKTSKKTAKKSSDNFDREEYEALAKHFKVYGKHGCYRFARKTIYGLMGKGYVKDGKVVITKRTTNSVLKTLTSEAEKCGEAWATGKVAEIKKAMA